MHTAAYCGQEQTVDFLTSLGCDSECRNSTEMTPLLMAAEMGKAKVVRVLIEKEAVISAKDSNGRTALHW